MLPRVEFLVLHRCVDGVCALLALFEKVRGVEVIAGRDAEKSREHHCLSFFVEIILRLDLIILAFLHFRI